MSLEPENFDSDQSNDLGLLSMQAPTAFQTNASIDELLALEGRLSDDHPLHLYANQQVQKLLRAGENFQVLVLENPKEINAFAARDGRIILDKKLMEFCESDEELLYVLQHELNHIRKEHHKMLEAVANNTEKNPIDTTFRLIGSERIAEMLEADLEGIVELDRIGINIDGALTFIRRLMSVSDEDDDLGHGSHEDRLLAVKSLFLLKDLKHFKEGSQTAKPTPLNDPGIYLSDRAFPVADTVITKPEKWLKRERDIQKMSAYELRKNLNLLKNTVNSYLQQREDLAKSKSKFAERFLNDINRYLAQAEPFLAIMDEAFINRVVKEGISEEIVLATGNLKECLSGEKDWHDIFADTESVKNIRLIFGGDINLWGSIFRDFKGSVSRNMDEALEMELLAVFSSEDERDAAKQILALICTGDWLNTQPKKNKAKLNLDELKGWEEYDLHILDSINDLWFGEKWAVNGLRKKAEIKSMRKRLFQQWNGVEKTVLARQINKKPYSKEFLAIFDTLKLSLRGGNRIMYLNLIARISTEITDLFEKNCLLSILEFASICCSSDENVTNIDDIKTRITAFMEDVDKLSPLSPESLLSSVDGCIENIFACEPGFDEGVKILDYLQNVVKVEDRYLWAFVRGWITRFDKPDISQMLSLDIELLKKAGAKAPFVFKLLEMINADPELFCRNRDQLNAVIDVCHNVLDSDKFSLYLTGLLEHLLDKYNDASAHAFYRLLNNFKFDLSKMEDCFLLLKLALFSQNPSEEHALEINIWAKIFENLERENISLMKFFQLVPPQIKIPYESLVKLIEQRTEDEDDLKICERIAEKNLKDPFELGKTVLLHDNVRQLISEDKLAIMKAMLQRNNDKDLKRILLQYSLLSKDGKEFTNTVQNTPNDLHGVMSKIAAAACPDNLLKELYGTDLMQRRIMVHLMLTGENGILKDNNGIDEILDQLFDEYVLENDEADLDFKATVKKIIKTAFREARNEDVYLIILDILAKRILQCSYKDNWMQNPFMGLYKTAIDSLLQGAESHHDRYSLKELLEDGEPFDEAENYAQLDSALELGVYGRMNGRDYTFNEDRKGLNALLTIPKTGKTAKLSTENLLFELAQSLKSIGTRSLQVADMYMDLPQKYKAVTSRIYSDVEGQSKLTAYQTILANIPETDRGHLRMGPRMGGGAMVCVYPFESDSMEGVVKVVNPNIEAFTESTFKILEKTFAKLEFEDPKKYSVMNLLLADIRWWVLADMDLSASASLDEEFAALNNGFSSGSVGIRVPEVRFRSQKCLIEAKQKGASLDRLKLSPEEAEASIQAVHANIRHQVMSGIMHSDVHPGNILRMSDGNLSWLDRTLLLKLRPEDQMLLFGIEMAESEDEKLQAFVGGLLNLPENANVNADQKAELFEEIANVSGSNFEDRLKNLAIRLRMHKYFQIPPHLTLVFKNLLALHKLGEKISSK